MGIASWQWYYSIGIAVRGGFIPAARRRENAL